MSDVQGLFADFALQTHLIWIFLAWALDTISGNMVAVKNGCWNSQTAKRGLTKLLTCWIPALMVDYVARASGIEGGAAFGGSLEAYIVYVELGSALENIGVVHNDTTIMNVGQAMKAKISPPEKAPAANPPKS